MKLPRITYPPRHDRQFKYVMLAVSVVIVVLAWRGIRFAVPLFLIGLWWLFKVMAKLSYWLMFGIAIFFLISMVTQKGRYSIMPTPGGGMGDG